MTHYLPWVALILSGLVLGHAAARSAAKKSLLGDGGVFVPAAILVLIAGVLATLPTAPPWSRGQAIAPGLLLGGAAVLLASLVGDRSRFGTAESAAFLASGAQLAAAALAMSVVGLLYSTFRGGILNVTSGFAVGAVAVGILVAGGLRLTGHGERAQGAEFATLAAVGVGIATHLAVYHQNPAGIREWLPLPALFTALLAGALTARGLVGGAGHTLTFGVVLLPVAILAGLIGYKLGGSPDFLIAVGVGLATFLVLAWLEAVEAGEAPGPALRADIGLLGSLAVLGGSALAFREQHGYGVALTALTGLGVAAAVPDTTGKRRGLVLGGVTLALLLALYRIFEEGYETSGFRPDLIYYFVALVGGALLPALVAAGATRAGTAHTPVTALLRVGLAGAVAVAAPLLLYFLVGERPQTAMLVGLAVGAGFLLSRGIGGEDTGERSLAGLVALAMSLSAYQLTTLLQTEALDLRTRGQRITVLVVVAVVALAWMGISAWLERGAGGTGQARGERREARG